MKLVSPMLNSSDSFSWKMNYMVGDTRTLNLKVILGHSLNTSLGE